LTRRLPCTIWSANAMALQVRRGAGPRISPPPLGPPRPDCRHRPQFLGNLYQGHVALRQAPIALRAFELSSQLPAFTSGRRCPLLANLVPIAFAETRRLVSQARQRISRISASRVAPQRAHQDSMANGRAMLTFDHEPQIHPARLGCPDRPATTARRGHSAGHREVVQHEPCRMKEREICLEGSQKATHPINRPRFGCARDANARRCCTLASESQRQEGRVGQRQRPQQHPPANPTRRRLPIHRDEVPLRGGPSEPRGAVGKNTPPSTRQ